MNGSGNSNPKTGVLLVNLGTPDEPTPLAVRRYLGEFLSDKRVIGLPRLLWWPILHGIILRTRPARSAKAYEKIWMEEGSPLLVNSRRIAEQLQVTLDKQIDGQLHVELGMRYGNPSIHDAFVRFQQGGIDRLLVLPLYPQYSHSTTASTLDKINALTSKGKYKPEILFIDNYHDHPEYVNAIADSIKAHWITNGRAGKLVLSFHGLPKRNVEEDSDPYYRHCFETTQLIMKSLELSEDECRMTFQSRFGYQEWIKPYTNQTLEILAENGTESVDIVCPGFPADCLETLEEIAMQNRDVFLNVGGRRYHYIPALNDQPSHISMLAGLVIKYVHGWQESIKAQTVED